MTLHRACWSEHERTPAAEVPTARLINLAVNWFEELKTRKLSVSRLSCLLTSRANSSAGRTSLRQLLTSRGIGQGRSRLSKQQGNGKVLAYMPFYWAPIESLSDGSPSSEWSHARDRLVPSAVHVNAQAMVNAFEARILRHD